MRLAQLAMLGNPGRDRRHPDVPPPHQGWLDFGTSSLAGHSLRPWPITVLYALAPSDTWRVIAQFLIATCCWSFCIWQFARLAPNRLASLALGLTVAGLAGASGVSGFDAALLSESFTVSMVALFVGGLLSVGSGRGRVPTMTATFVAASLLGILRPVLIPLVVVAVLGAGLGLAKSARPYRSGPRTCARPGHARRRNRRLRLELQRAGRSDVGRLDGRAGAQRPDAHPVLPRRVHDPVMGRRSSTPWSAAGAPACIRQRVEPAADDAPVDRVRVDRLGCPDGQAWLSERYLSTLARPSRPASHRGHHVLRRRPRRRERRERAERRGRAVRTVARAETRRAALLHPP